MARCTDGVGTRKFLESASRMCDELKLNVVVLGSVGSGKRAVLVMALLLTTSVTLTNLSGPQFLCSSSLVIVEDVHF